MLAFHGFGQKPSVFDYFTPALGMTYTIYAFRFFHHGHSVYPTDRIHSNTLTPEELQDFFNSFLEEKQLHRISLMGFSMGGKIALCLLERFAPVTDRIFLLAPDGLAANWWYHFTSRHKLGNYLYRKIIEKPEPFFKLLKLLRTLRLMGAKRYRFVLQHLENRTKREQVYRVWMTLRHIRPEVRKSAALIRRNQIDCHLLMGRYDRIIPLRAGRRFCRLTGQAQHLHILECGHNLIGETALRELKKIS